MNYGPLSLRWSIPHLCGVAPQKYGRCELLMIRSFLDESGNISVFMIAAWLGQAEEWDRFSVKWQKALRAKPRISYFKHHEAMSFEGEFTGWTEKARDNKLVKLATVIADHDVNGLAGGMYLPRYDPVISASRLSKAQLKKILKIVQPYHNCFHAMVGQTLHLELDKGPSAQVVDFIFDEHSMLKECVQLYFEMKETMRPEMKAIAGSIVERNDRDVLPLQAADLLAGQILLSMKRSSLAKTRVPLEKGSPMQIMSSHRPIGMFQAFPPYFEQLPTIIDELNRLHDMKKWLSEYERLRRKNEDKH